MKKILGNILTIVIIVGLVIFIQYKFFPNVIDNSTHTSDTIYQDTGRIVYTPQPYPIFVDTGRIDTIILPIDSAAIVEKYLELHQDYYSTYFYKDTVKNDSTAFIEIQSEITQNKPVRYDLVYYDRTPTVINNTTNIYSKKIFPTSSYDKSATNVFYVHR